MPKKLFLGPLIVDHIIINSHSHVFNRFSLVNQLLIPQCLDQFRNCPLCIHTFPDSRVIYSNRSSVSRRPAQKGVYHCFSFFYSRSASFIHKHGHNTSHTPFLSDLNKERYALHPIEQLISFVPELFNGCSLMSIFVGREWVITPFFVQDVTGGATNDVQDYEV